MTHTQETGKVQNDVKVKLIMFGQEAIDFCH